MFDTRKELVRVLIEIVILNYLKERLQMQEIYPEMPDKLPNRFITFDIIDRDKQDYINVVTIEFKSYAESQYQAAVLDERLREAIEDMTEVDEIGSVKIGGGDNGKDTTHKRYRYRCIYNIWY